MEKTNPRKKIQKHTPRLILAKNYIEQELQSQGHGGHVRYDCTNKALVQFRIKKGTVAVLKQGKLCIFKMPVKKFKGSLPLEIESVEIDSIKTVESTCCKKCNSWKQSAGITRCKCGGYLVSRTRFTTGTVESWSEEFLEIRFAQKDIANAMRTNRVLSRRPKKYQYSGITSKLAGMCSIKSDEPTHDSETLLVPKGNDIKEIRVRPVTSCSLIFASTIKEDAKILSDVDKMGLLKKYSTNPTEERSDRVFASEAKRFIIETAPAAAIPLMNSWNNPLSKVSKVSKRKANSLKKKLVDRVRYTLDIEMISTITHTVPVSITSKF